MQLCAHICQKEICKKCVPKYYESNAHHISSENFISGAQQKERKKEREKRDTLDPDDRSSQH
jgi:hypothetical protein